MYTKTYRKIPRKEIESLEWQDNITMDFKQIGCEGVDWIQRLNIKIEMGGFVKAVIKSAHEPSASNIDPALWN
jgi:hypothetical protein